MTAPALSWEAALALLLELILPLPPEGVALADADGRVLAEEVRARLDAPRQAVATMDGYAVRTGDLASGQPLPVAGIVPAGDLPGRALPAGAALRIYTGAPLPGGADRVIPQERAQVTADRVRFAPETLDPAAPRHVRAQGSDFRANDPLLAEGRRLDPGAVVLAGAADRGRLQVRRRPRVALLATGDELVGPGLAAARPGTVPESVTAALAALVRRVGGLVRAPARAQDEAGDLARAVQTLSAQGPDCLVVTGGASVGDRDLARPALAALGLQLSFAGVAMKPGRPVWAGRLGGLIVLGLPGNPGSALVTGRLFLVPLLNAWQGATLGLDWRPAVLTEALPETGARETFVRGRSGWDGEGRALVTPVENQESGAQRPLAEADLLIRRAIGAPPVAAGAIVSVLPLFPG